MTPLQWREGNILCINPSRQLFSSPFASSLLLSLRRHRRHHDLRLADVGKFFRRDRGRSYVTAQHEGRGGQNYHKVVECKHDFKERGGRSKKFQTFSLYKSGHPVHELQRRVAASALGSGWCWTDRRENWTNGGWTKLRTRRSRVGRGAGWGELIEFWAKVWACPETRFAS